MPKNGRATPEDIETFLGLLDQGFSIERASKAVGRTKQWGYALLKRLRDPSIKVPDRMARNRSDKLPDPKSLEQLDGGVRDTLADFNLFCEVFLLRDPSPWRKDAAERVVERLLDRSRKDFIVTNCPPGSGKSTLFTFDIPLWLICGGGAQDPAWGRALRLLLGSESKNVAISYVKFLRDTLDHRRPYYDKDKAERGEPAEAELCIAIEFGRFRPIASLGEDSLWEKNQFTVAQLAHLDIYDKEPTCQAASKESGFLGNRVNYSVWDDLSTGKNSKTVEQQEEMSRFSRTEAETRTEPGGVFNLVGQRLSPLDLFRDRLDASYTDHEGVEHHKFDHIVYPAHFEHLCPNGGELGPGCFQWDGAESGCLLDARRLPWTDLQAVAAEPDYRMLYQQEDTNPVDVLVKPAWIDGGTDDEGFSAPGCYDRERAFLEWPETESVLFDYATVDPSATRYWAAEHWSLSPTTEYDYLVNGERRKMTSGGSQGFLDYDPEEKCFVGLMEDWQVLSGEMGHPIRMWIVEQNAAHKYLFGTIAFKLWRKKWPMVKVIAHETQKNKNDPNFGVFATLPMVYRRGFKRLPRRKAYGNGDTKALRALTYVRQHKVPELTHYPNYRTSDTVMADWFGEMRRDLLLKEARNLLVPIEDEPDALPARLARRG